MYGAFVPESRLDRDRRRVCKAGRRRTLDGQLFAHISKDTHQDKESESGLDCSSRAGALRGKDRKQRAPVAARRSVRGHVQRKIYRRLLARRDIHVGSRKRDPMFQGINRVFLSVHQDLPFFALRREIGSLQVDEQTGVRAVPEFKTTREMGSRSCGKFNMSGIYRDQGTGGSGQRTKHQDARSKNEISYSVIPAFAGMTNWFQYVGVMV